MQKEQHVQRSQEEKRTWYIKKLREEQCGYNTVSRGDGLDMEKVWLFLKGYQGRIKKDSLFSGFDKG